MNETAPKRNIPLCVIVGNGLCAVPNCVFKESSVEWHIGNSLHKHFETTPLPLIRKPTLQSVDTLIDDDFEKVSKSGMLTAESENAILFLRRDDDENCFR